MALFVFGKKKKEKNQTSACLCKCSSHTSKSTEINGGFCCEDAKNGICCIKILGAGCKSCHQQYENVKKAVAELGLSVEVEYITDMEKVMSYGVMSMPAIIVNEKVITIGKVLKPDEVVKLLNNI